MLSILALISEVLPIVLYLIFLKRNRGEGLWVIFLYSCLSFLTEPFFFILELKIPVYIVYSGFTILEFTLFSFFFYSSLQEKRFKYISVIGALIFYVIAFSSFTNQQEHPFDSLAASVEAILIISYCILLLYEQIRDPSVIFVYDTKKFWVIIAFFLYFSSTLFLFVYSGTINEQQRHNYWAINNFFEILKNILFCISFIMKKSDKPAYAIDEFDA